MPARRSWQQVYLKVLAYNLSRLATGKPLACVLILVGAHDDAYEILDAWLPTGEQATTSLFPSPP